MSDLDMIVETEQDIKELTQSEPVTYYWEAGGLYLYGFEPYEYIHKDELVHNGKVYTCETKCNAMIPHEFISVGEKPWCVYFLDGERKYAEVKDREYKERIFGFAPFTEVHSVYDNTKLHRIDSIHPWWILENRSKDVTACMYLQIGSALGFEVDISSSTKNERPKKKNDIIMRHTLYEWGYGHYVYLDFRFDDLLNMDIEKLEPNDVSRLEDECRHNSVVRDSLNFDVFTRPLTEVEKLECAVKVTAKFSKELLKQDRKNYATS